MPRVKLTRDDAGSLSSGTLRPDHLWDAFMPILRVQWPEKALELDRELEGFQGTEEEREDRLSEILNEDLFDAMGEIGPPGFYFGNLESDGAEFGWWPIEKDDEAGLEYWNYA